MQMQYRCRWNHCMRLWLAAAERRLDKHADLENAWIGNLNAHLRRAQAGVEHRPNVADTSCKHLVRIRADVNLRCLPQLQLGQIIFEDITENPDMRKIGNREGRRGA